MSRSLLSSVVLSLLLAGLLPACTDRDRAGNERWVETEKTNAKIDWDKLAKAYKGAEGPEDFEKKVNELYEGSEIVSVSVKDEGNETQIVTGFIDKNDSGSVDEGEKIFAIRRVIDSEGSGNYRVRGYGHYHGYHSPMMSIASGMIMGSMLSRAFRPGYRPMYSRPYTTSVARRGGIASHRTSYRAKNPSRFGSAKRGKTGRRYGTGNKARGRSPRRSSGRRGGFRFGIKRRRGTRVRISA